MRSSEGELGRKPMESGGGSCSKIAAIKLAWLLAYESLSPSSHLVQHSTKSENVGPRIGFFALQLFGSHALQRAKNHSFAGQGRRLCWQRRHAGLSLRHFHFRQPKVQKLRSRFRQHDVAGLQITMNHAVPARGIERAANFDRVL